MKDVIAECLDSLEDLSNWDEKIFEVVCKSATSCCSMLLEALDEELARERDKVMWSSKNGHFFKQLSLNATSFRIPWD